ncbi:MAG: lysophospholipase, partial [Belnapia sp.]|nr:lysophospholipase [Belnapia sp.]
MRNLAGLLLAMSLAMPAAAQPAPTQAPAPSPGMAWATSWAASAQGPYPVGNPSAQPDQRFAFPDPARGARDQTLRLILRPSLWGQRIR